MYLTAANLVHYLLGRGLVTRESVVEGDFLVAESRRRNRNYRLFRSHHPALFIKQVPSVVAETVASLRREAACYRMAGEGGEFAPFKAIMPRLLDYNSANHTLVTELVAGAESLNEYCLRSGSYTESIARMQARSLALYHHWTFPRLAQLDAKQVFARQRPWIFSIHEHAEWIMPNMGEGLKQVVVLLRQQPEMGAGLAQLGAGWQQICLIHGDIKWDNFLITPKKLDSSFLDIVDWELADIGDPAWDVAGILAAYIQPSLLAQGYAGYGTIAAGQAAPPTLAQVWPAIAAFWDEYSRCMKLTPAQAAYQLSRSVAYLGGRLVLLIFEMLQNSAQITPSAHTVLQVAREVLVNPSWAQGQLLGLSPSYQAASTGVKAPDQSFALFEALLVPSRPAQAVSAPDLGRNGNSGKELPASIRDRLIAICEKVSILSPASFRYDGQEPVTVPQVAALPYAPLAPGQTGQIAQFNYPGVQAQAWAAGTANQSGANGYLSEAALTKERLIEALWPVLYWHGYARDPASATRSNGNGALAKKSAEGQPSDAVFQSQLSAANQSQNHWDPAWEVYQLGQNGSVHVKKGDRYRMVMAGQYAYAGSPGGLTPIGARVDLLVLREFPNLQPGFYFAFGETIASDFDDAQLGRLYFNCRPEGVCWLLEFLSGELNRCQIPFRFKCLNQAAGYQLQRNDAAVLYLAKRHLGPALSLLAERRTELSSRIHSSVPLFAKEMLPGMGAADDPGTGESFGQARMRLVSRAIVEAWYSGKTNGAARLEAVNQQFQDVGLALDRPHVNGGNADVYEWPV
jgi:hypothetical protein